MDWILKNKKGDLDRLSSELSISKILCRILVNRGFSDKESMDAFLHPEKGTLHDASLLRNAEEAAKQILLAVTTKKKIRIIGDYDVDGIMSTYILYQTLRTLLAEVDYVIPDRLTDGYGMNMRMVEEAGLDQVALLLTCDNGIAAIEPIRRAKELGLTVVVTDHHDIRYKDVNGEKQYELPEADCIVNPKQPGDGYPQSGICGAMVAYKVVTLLVGMCPDFPDAEAFLSELLVMVSLATVCDVMELTGENRVVVKKGLKALPNCKNIGIRALLTACKLLDQEVTAYHAGFVLGPCFNATGRLESALLGLKLLLCEDFETALATAEKFRELNEKRKKLTGEATEQAAVLAAGELAAGNQVLVLFLPDCHESIAGIVAGRIRERFYRPTLILTRGEKSCKGSGRSIPCYSMFEKLTEQKELMTAFGGHPMAAGLSIEEENIPVLREKLNQASGLTEGQLVEKLYLDAVLPFSSINEALITELSLLSPCGNGNEAPVFAASGVLLTGYKKMGKEGNHCKLSLMDQNGGMIDGLMFYKAEEFEGFLRKEYGEEVCTKLQKGCCSSEVLLSLAFSADMNEYMGRKTPQIRISSYKRTV